ncbi:MAG: GNAT family N-acetyltransferase [Rudaea sp.]
MFTIRPITRADNATVAAIIRSVMPEFGACGPGFAIHDAEVDDMHGAYTLPRCAYFVIELDGTVCGGGGIAPLAGADSTICELRKMYFLPSLRGLGAGDALLAHCLDTARKLGFEKCYLETLTGMDAAQRLYQRHAFTRIPAALGDTGHFSCDRFYMREL